ncbi:MAG: hypothetical protein J5915_10195 [Acidaminococcaceae bacterium]|nr:hypothetical protein [Acidaminococcaceae bacterium]
MTVDELIIELALDDKKVDSGINRVKSSLSSFSGFVTGIGMAFGQLFGNMILGLADTIPCMFNEMKEDVRVLDDISKKVNANVEDIAAWGDAIEMSGGSAKGFQNTLVSLSSDLSRLSITGKARSKPFLEALGLDPKALSAKPIMDVLQDISNAVQGMDKQTSGFALKNIGFDPDAIKFLQSGNVEGLIAKQKELGVYTAKDAEAIDKMDKTIKQISHTFKTLAIPLFSAVIDTVAKVAVYVEKAITLIRKNTDVLKGALLALMILFSGPLLAAVQRFFTLLMAHPFMMVIAAVAGLALLLEDLWVYANDGESAFEGLWEKLGTPQEVMSGFERIGEVLSSIGDVMEDKQTQIAAVFTMLAVLIGAVVAGIISIPAAIAAGLALIIAYWEEISQFFADIVEAFKIVGRMIASIFEIAGQAIGDALSGAADIAKSAWNGFISWLEEKWDWIKSLLPSLSGIASKLPSLGNSPAALTATGGSGGTTNVSTVTDNRKVDIHNHSEAAASASMERMDLVGFGNKGVK